VHLYNFFAGIFTAFILACVVVKLLAKYYTDSFEFVRVMYNKLLLVSCFPYMVYLFLLYSLCRWCFRVAVCRVQEKKFVWLLQNFPRLLLAIRF